MPDPARWLDRPALAVHLCIREAAISRLVRAGRIPQPSYHLGPRSPRWDRQAVDTAFSGKVASTNVETLVNAYIQNTLQRGPSRRAAGAR